MVKVSHLTQADRSDKSSVPLTYLAKIREIALIVGPGINS